MLIGISGYAKSGKNAAAEILQRLYPAKKFQIKGFSTALKEVASILTGLPASSFEDQKIKAQKMPVRWTNNGHLMTYREFLQKLGTESVRDVLHPDAWPMALMAPYDEAYLPFGDGSEPNWIIPDCRFPNEADSIKFRGGIIVRINRPGTKPVNAHLSETSLDDYAFDHKIRNNGTLEELELQLQTFFNPILL